MTTSLVTEVPLDTLSIDRFLPLIGPTRQQELRAAAERVRVLMTGRTLWNVNSTAKGGGVAEILSSLLPYARGAGVEARWLVIDGDDDFFTVSKRIHNQLHGDAGDGKTLENDARQVYERTLARNGRDLEALIEPGDVVLFHDPQTAGLVETARTRQAATAWRCHVGTDTPNDRAHQAWDFLRPYIDGADRCIFTRRNHVWDGLDDDRIVIIPPSIDAFTPKNQTLNVPTVDAILVAAGILGGTAHAQPNYVNRTGETLVVHRRATVTSGPIPSSSPLVVQVSRWDTLKDPVGVLRGFADHVAPHHDAHLVLAGPATDSIDDDPEQADTLGQVTTAWNALGQGVRGRVHLVSLPMEDEDENATIVNALQRRATVVVQKSLAEGFGLTVAESMWKRRPVVASAVGGITEQITDNETGVLVQEPEDAEEFGHALLSLLTDPERAARLGEAAHRRVCAQFLTPRELLQLFELVEDLLRGARPRSP